ncbi:hypothetical protein [Bacillus wiedmannii]|nr:hypothetical protein [Bacillus wiedmannii]EEK65877.1 hypothetical protein bcere0006_39910 [Bacillus wiedmannii]
MKDIKRGEKMSNGIGRSKENLPTDANHVSAKDRASQKRMAKKKQQERNEDRE